MKRNAAGWNVLLVLMLVSLVAAGCGSGGEARSSDGKTMKWDRMPEMAIDLNKTYSARFQTNKGAFTVELFANEAPVTVNNFVFLARERFYDGLTFHRIIESYMIQGGDPNGDGTGTPGYTIPDELDTSMKYEPGIVAMLNFGKPNTGGSQFFISTGPDSANLNRNPSYTIFGKVSSGMDTVMKIAKTPVKDSKPVEPVVIESVIIEES